MSVCVCFLFCLVVWLTQPANQSPRQCFRKTVVQSSESRSFVENLDSRLVCARLANWFVVCVLLSLSPSPSDHSILVRACWSRESARTRCTRIPNPYGHTQHMATARACSCFGHRPHLPRSQPYLLTVALLISVGVCVCTGATHSRLAPAPYW